MLRSSTQYQLALAAFHSSRSCTKHNSAKCALSSAKRGTNNVCQSIEGRFFISVTWLPSWSPLFLRRCLQRQTRDDDVSPLLLYCCRSVIGSFFKRPAYLLRRCSCNLTRESTPHHWCRSSLSGEAGSSLLFSPLNFGSASSNGMVVSAT